MADTAYGHLFLFDSLAVVRAATGSPDQIAAVVRREWAKVARNIDDGHYDDPAEVERRFVAAATETGLDEADVRAAMNGHRGRPGGERRFTRTQAWAFIKPHLDELAVTAPGGRNAALNNAGCVLWHFLDVPDGLDRATAERMLTDAAAACSLDRDDGGMAAVQRTIASALDGGPSGDRWKATIVPDNDLVPDIAPSTPPPLVFHTLAELRAKVAAAGPRQWLLRGIWPAGDYGVHAAEMKGQKTWAAVDLAVSVASGTDWLGVIPVDHPGPVVMFYGEGSEANLVRRIDAVCVSRGIDPDTLPIVICTRAPKLSDLAHLAIMAEKIAEVRPALVVLDPFYLSARGAKGGDLYAMGAMLEDAQHICQDHGAALFVVTHHNRNTGAAGAMRITGAGPAEWGRVLITATVKSRRKDPDTAETTVVTELEVIGGEVPGGTWRVTRKIRADDPDDLNSPLHYHVTAREHEPSDGGDEDMPPARRKLLDAVRAADGPPRTIRQLQDWIAAHCDDGIVPTRPTCSRELNALLKAGLVDAIDVNGTKQWIARDAGNGGVP